MPLWILNVIGFFWSKPKYLLALIVLLLALGAGGYIVYLRFLVGTAEKRAQEAVSQEGQIRIDEAKQNVNKASANINAVQNANYSNLSNDELRRKMINAARNIK